MDDEPVYGEVAAVVNGEVVGLSSEEAKTVCELNYCEVNQIYTSQFGRRRRRELPAPAPVLPPAPAPVPPTDPVKPPSGFENERFDYSRSVLGLEEAWSVTEGEESVVVAVIDTGVETSHPDLQERIWVSPTGERGYDFVRNRPHGEDDAGHGTHCAGIIGASKNEFGVRGVAPKVKLMPLKFLSNQGRGDTVAAVQAIQYAVRNGAKILSNSWGGGGYSSLLENAIREALRQGVIFVAAAGNNNSDNDRAIYYPASYPGVLAVGSTDERDQRSSFSNYGRERVHVFAPGSNILSTYVGGRYQTLSGTSMATPQVAGALALALSHRSDLSPSALFEALCRTSEGSLQSFSKCGRMHVGKLLKSI
jgi:subtilisin family serine protease